MAAASESKRKHALEILQALYDYMFKSDCRCRTHRQSRFDRMFQVAEFLATHNPQEFTDDSEAIDAFREFLCH